MRPMKYYCLINTDIIVLSLHKLSKLCQHHSTRCSLCTLHLLPPVLLLLFLLQLSMRQSRHKNLQHLPSWKNRHPLK